MKLPWGEKTLSVGETFLVDGGVWFKLKTVLTSESKVGATASCLGWELV